ncbi:PAS domain S-box protein [Ferruginibacter yonginensis]|uniref:histidine kinase n=1 Tax=Ferruginibacter yonginensis TaxID=1310416 RepID=A0ABV8QR51_9BACT
MKQISIPYNLKLIFFSSIIITGILLILIYINISNTAAENKKENATLVTLQYLENTLIKLQTIETVKRVYVATGDAVFLKEYQNAVTDVNRTLKELRYFNIPINVDSSAINNLKKQIEFKIAHTNKVVESRRVIGVDSSTFINDDITDKTLMDAAIQPLSNLVNDQRNKLNEYNQTNQKNADWLTLLSITLAIVFVITGATSYVIIRKDYSKSAAIINILEYNSSLLNNISDAIITTDTNGFITEWNGFAAELYGYTFEEVKNKPINEVLKVLQQPTNNTTQPIDNNIQIQNGEAIHHHKNGTAFYVEVNSSFFKNAQQEVIGVIATIRNISKRVALQQRLTALSENLQQQVNQKAAELTFFYERIADAFVALDVNWNYTYLNKAAEQLYGKNAHELLGKNIGVMYPSLTNEPFYNALQQAQNTQLPQNCEYFNAENNTWQAILIYPASDGISFYYHDITSRKDAELNLKKVHEKLSFHINNTPLAIIEFDANMKITQWSEKAQELFGLSDADVFSPEFNVTQIIYEPDVQLVFEAMLPLSSHQSSSIIIKNRNITKSGNIIFCEWYNSVLKDDDNNVIGILSLVKDVTNDSINQLQLKNAEAKFRGLVEQSMVGVYIRKQNKLLYVNPKFAEIFGYTEAEILDDFSSYTLVHESDVEHTKLQFKKYNDGVTKFHHYEFLGVKKDGTKINIEVFGTLTTLNNEEVVIGSIIDITDRKKAIDKLKISEDALRSANERFEIVSKATNDIIWDWDMQTHELKGNEIFQHFFNVAPHQSLKFEDFLKRVPIAQVELLRQKLIAVLKQQETLITYDYTLMNTDGSENYFYNRAYIMYNSEGRAYRMIGAMQDVTARKQVEQQLLFENQLSESIINSLPGVFYLFDKNGQFKRWNKNVETVTGYNAAEMATLNPLQLFVDDQKILVHQKIMSVFENGTDNVEAFLTTKNGNLIPFYFTGMRIVYKGEPCLLGIGLDISEKVKSQEALIKSEEKFRTLVQQASDGIIITNEEGIIYDVNEKIASLTGYSLQELSVMNVNDIFYEDTVLKKSFRYREMTSGMVFLSERIIKRKNGKFINVEVSAKQLSDGRFQKIIRDITERKMVEEALIISEKKYRILFNENPMPMWILSLPERKFIDVNAAAIASYGYTREAFLQMHLADIHPEKNWQFDDSLLYKDGGVVRHQGIWNHQKKDGTIIKVNVISHNIMYDGASAILALANDITVKFEAEANLKKSHEALRELASHLEAVREQERTHIAREIHDELGQQLTGLKMDISWLNKKIRSEDAAIQQKMKDAIDLIDQTVISVRRISTQLRPSILDDLGLIAAMEWQCEEFEKRSGIQSKIISNITEINIGADVATGLFRIFQESLTNVSRHAKATQVITNFMKYDDHITLIIEDNGIGFKEVEIANKKTLGLLGMKERVLLINGTYEINGQSGKGTSVIITVPLFNNNQN